MNLPFRFIGTGNMKRLFVSLQLLPDNIGDPMELLSYLGPSDANNSNNSNNSTAGDDLFALFDS